MMLRLHQHPPEVLALAQFELYKIIADAEARTGPEDFDLPEKIVIQLVCLIQIFLKEDVFSDFGIDLLPVVKLVSELGKKCPHIEGGRHRIGTAEINSSHEPGRGVVRILSDKNIFGMEISVSLYQLLRVFAIQETFRTR